VLGVSHVTANAYLNRLAQAGILKLVTHADHEKRRAREWVFYSQAASVLYRNTATESEGR